VQSRPEESGQEDKAEEKKRPLGTFLRWMWAEPIRRITIVVAVGALVASAFIFFSGAVSVAAFKDLAEITALVVAGVWTYMLFVQGRTRFPRASITHRITHHSTDSGPTLLQVKAVIKNDGTVILRIPNSSFRVQRVLPLPDNVVALLDKGEDPVVEGNSEVVWERASPPRRRTLQMQIEPGESDEVLADFFIDPELRLVEVYTFFENEKARPNGWGLTTLYALDASHGASERTVQDLAGRRE
jgi:hypothetical protein